MDIERLKKEHPDFAAIIEKRMLKAQSDCAKDQPGFMRRAQRAGVANHDMGCMCPKCKLFWGESSSS